MAIVQSVNQDGLSLSSPIRDSFMSSGRGGSGNIRRSFVPRDTRLTVDIDIVSIREREREGPSNPDRALGRGGSGNIRPPSPDLATLPLTAEILSQHAATQVQYEEQVRKLHAESRKLVRSSGRGGAGNISRNHPSTCTPSKRSATKERVKSILYTNAHKQVKDEKGEHVCSARTWVLLFLNYSHRLMLAYVISTREPVSCEGNLMSSSGTESQPVERSRSSTVSTASGSGCSCSPSSQDGSERSRKKRSLLMLWNKPSNRTPPSRPADHVSVISSDSRGSESSKESLEEPTWNRDSSSLESQSVPSSPVSRPSVFLSPSSSSRHHSTSDTFTFFYTPPYLTVFFVIVEIILLG
ncbi:hypothetical protein F5I97DRAFT_1930421 [Phlebopus sp. FC_14]|nr:hypothetical protein F5I97DRAFT_1930421 [Phlebopus sp. FC_14]